ncbi:MULTISPECIES: beta-class carbonic anhydrase [Aneurinibacillus]|uniref:carbonic anhydrase n=1 Tax=Aneurinibacillus thermoaerophilus TaxID=143495 RepID=A0A1G8F8Q6_ANETH|nr:MULTISPECIES: carbonic anhydrase [Aneurinibacillus]AMA74373.1 carbonic anhydrase [Aneurinibacillus sp. XH2]MED0676803.1 carbonic anhydrase [Aneurinibacillus thermoaerophilus]MED0738894.1 carbonic anhydrase [Aneurinibacillus thermoaerophilus]MED0757870.1 carbonic anhydrase [Aneurinibacillus thermoaerophilus]MED0762145.1 carbonic anhydrase [Aneurinibacillus thermoaerophilus]
MSVLAEIMEYNRNFVENKKYEEFRTTKYPDKGIVILTCMDTRLIELLPRAMNLRNGDAKIIKNAGAMVTHPFGSIMRSILVAVYELQAKEVFVVGHHDCGMTSLKPGSVLEKMKQSGISEDRIETLQHAGIELDKWLTGFNSVAESVKQTVYNIKKHPLFPPHSAVHGLVIHPETGKLDLVVKG